MTLRHVLLVTSLILGGCAAERGAERGAVSRWNLEDTPLAVVEATRTGSATNLRQAPLAARDPRLGSTDVVSAGSGPARDHDLICVRGPGVERLELRPGEGPRSWVAVWEGGQGSHSLGITFGERRIQIWAPGRWSLWGALPRRLVLLLDADGRISVPAVLEQRTLRTREGELVSLGPDEAFDPEAEPARFVYEWVELTFPYPVPLGDGGAYFE